MSKVTDFFMKAMFGDNPEPKARLRDTRLAACALLLELAHADAKFSEAERKHLRGAVRRQFGLEEMQATELLDLAEQERARAVDLYQFTTLIKEHYSKGQKMVLLEVMWGLVYADGELQAKEEYLMRKICGLLDLEVGYLADVKKAMDKNDKRGESV